MTVIMNVSMFLRIATGSDSKSSSGGQPDSKKKDKEPVDEDVDAGGHHGGGDDHEEDGWSFTEVKIPDFTDFYKLFAQLCSVAG